MRWGPLVNAIFAIHRGTWRAGKVAAGSGRAFAAFAYVGESVENPAIYYENNTAGTLALLNGMRAAGCRHILFSSTCQLQRPQHIPIDESHPQAPINPRLVEDDHRANVGGLWQAYGIEICFLRYFNAAGADPEGNWRATRARNPRHPLAIEAARRSDRPFTSWARFSDARRQRHQDYVHVNDLARAHLLAGEMLVERGGTHVFIWVPASAPACSN